MPQSSRSYTMSCIHSKNTKPEIIVRKYLWKHGFRYRLNHPKLPGKPDVVLRKYRVCIFVNGCFWHGHEGCGEFRPPKSNIGFWTKKINRNKKRDKQVQIELANMGWHCVTIWECELKPDKREQTLKSLIYTLNKIFLQDHVVKEYKIDEEEHDMVAEELPVQ